MRCKGALARAIAPDHGVLAHRADAAAPGGPALGSLRVGSLGSLGSQPPKDSTRELDVGSLSGIRALAL